MVSYLDRILKIFYDPEAMDIEWYIVLAVYLTELAILATILTPFAFLSWLFVSLIIPVGFKENIAFVYPVLGILMLIFFLSLTSSLISRRREIMDDEVKEYSVSLSPLVLSFIFAWKSYILEYFLVVCLLIIAPTIRVVRVYTGKSDMDRHIILSYVVTYIAIYVLWVVTRSDIWVNLI